MDTEKDKDMNVDTEEDPPPKKIDVLGDDFFIDTEKVKNKTNKTIITYILKCQEDDTFLDDDTVLATGNMK